MNFIAAEELDKRIDFPIIEDLIEKKSKVLDLGCGDGILLKNLATNKNVTARGIEISEEGVAACISKGLSVFHGNIDEGLADFKKNSFDYVIAIRTVQAVFHPKKVILEMLRVGKKAIITFPNFGYIKVRMNLLFKGKMPKNEFLPYEWYNTPNIHHLTINNFKDFCKKEGITIEKEIFLPSLTHKASILSKNWPNMFAHYGMFVVSQQS